MPRFEFDHFNKFCASVGLFLIIAAPMLLWLFSQSTTVLAIPERDLTEFTEVAQEVLSQRQTMLLRIQEDYLLPTSVAIFLVGMLFLGIGLARWWTRQALADRHEESQYNTPVEQADSDSESAMQEDEFDQEDGPLPATVPSESAPSNPEQPNNQPSAAKLSYTEQRAQLRAHEAEIISKIREAYAGTFEILQDVRLADDNKSRPIIDILLEPANESKWGQLGIELKIASARNATVLAPDLMLRAALATNGLKLGTVHTGRKGRPPKAVTSGVLILAHHDQHPGRSEPLRLTFSRAQDTNDLLKSPIGVIIGPLSRLQMMSANELRDTITSVWVDPGTVQVLR